MDIQLTKSAADEIEKEIEEKKEAREKAKGRKVGETRLRVRVEEEPKLNNKLYYALGFDSQINFDDLPFESRDIPMVVSKVALKLAPKMEINFVKGKEGDPRFIFLNPNDPARPSEQKGLQSWGKISADITNKPDADIMNKLTNKFLL